MEEQIQLDLWAEPVYMKFLKFLTIEILFKQRKIGKKLKLRHLQQLLLPRSDCLSRENSDYLNYLSQCKILYLYIINRL